MVGGKLQPLSLGEPSQMAKVDQLPYIKPPKPLKQFSKADLELKLINTRQALNQVRGWIEEEPSPLSPELYIDLVQFEVDLLLIIREIEYLLEPTISELIGIWFTKVGHSLFGFFR